MAVASRFRRATHVGRVRLEAAQLLSEHFGDFVSGEDIDLALGFWRMSDVYRFDVRVFRQQHHQQEKFYGCWQSLTSFVRDAKRFGIEHDEGEVWAKEK